MHLDDLAVFERVVHHAGFTAAAQDLGLAKSTVSQRVARLEQRLGVRLLHRSTRSVRPTEAGAALAERMRHVLDQAREAERAVTRQEPHGTLRVTAPRLFGHAFLAPVIARCLGPWPELRVELELTERKVDLVREGFDMAIRVGVSGRLEDSALSARKLGETASVFVAAPGMNQPRAIGVAPPFAWPTREGPLPYEPVVIANSLVMARELAQAGVGLAWLPRFLVEEELARGALLSVFEEQLPPPFGVFAVFPSRRLISPKVRVFLDALVSESALDRPR
jgi:DNA-binding transcriptional LysR family regulator